MRLTLFLLAAGCAFSQPVPDPPPLRGDAASLKDTMRFLQEKLPAKVNFMVYIHNNDSGSDLTRKTTLEVYGVEANPEYCSIVFKTYTATGDSSKSEPGTLVLRLVSDVSAGPIDQALQKQSAENGHPEISYKVEPGVSVVMARYDQKLQAMFSFYDDTLADRVSRALKHAVDLCGGGNKDVF